MWDCFYADFFSCIFFFFLGIVCLFFVASSTEGNRKKKQIAVYNFLLKWINEVLSLNEVWKITEGIAEQLNFC